MLSTVREDKGETLSETQSFSPSKLSNCLWDLKALYESSQLPRKHFPLTLTPRPGGILLSLTQRSVATPQLLLTR